MIDLTGKRAVVTGAAQGIGAATAQLLADLGASVVVADVREDAAGEAAAAMRGSVTAHAVDIRSSASINTLLDDVVGELGGVDVWVNNAAVAENSLALDLDDETWSRTISVNLTGTFFGAREAGRRMIDLGIHGSIVNISSIAAFRATRPEHHIAYDVSKAAVAHMAAVLASEWAPFGVRVNAIAPGYTATELLKVVGSEDPATVENWISQVPQGRLIDPPEIATAIAFLASDVSKAFTGQTLHPDAGYTLW